MPQKNPRCPKCGRKLKHKEWLPKIKPMFLNFDHRNFADPGRIRQERILSCPDCDYETKDMKTRKMSVYKRWRVKIDAK